MSDERYEYWLLINDTISNFDSLPNIELRANKIKSYIIDNLKTGNIFGREYLTVYFIFKRLIPKHSQQIDSLINLYILEYSKYPKDSIEAFAINDNIFILEILNGNFKSGLENYIKRLFLLDYNFARKNPPQCPHNFIGSFLVSANVKPLLFKIVKDLFSIDFYFSLNKRDRRSVVNWVWNTLWGFTPRILLNERKEIEDIYEDLKDIIYKLISLDSIDEVLHFSMFVYNIAIEAFIQGQDEYKKLQDEIVAPCSQYYKKWIEKNKNVIKELPFKKIENGKKKKIALVRPNIGYWSPFIAEYSILKGLKEDKKFNDNYEIIVYSMDYFELWNSMRDDCRADSRKCSEMLMEIGSDYRVPLDEFHKDLFYNNHLNKIIKFREKIIEDQIDILIYSDHLYSCGEFLFLSRSAPKQIYWAHSNLWYDVEGIDKRITHFSPYDNRFEGNPFKWEFFTVTIDKKFLNPEEETKKREAERIKKYFPKGSIFLGSIGRLSKINNWEYLSTVAEIMKSNPETVYIACGTGNENEIKEKLKKLGISDRFYMVGFVDPHIYGYVIDIYLNTFPEPSGQSVVEFLNKGLNKFLVSL